MERRNETLHNQKIYNNYSEWKAEQSEPEQTKIIDEIKENYKHNDGSFRFNLERLNEKYNKAFFVWFRHTLETEIGELPANEYNIKFKVLGDNSWHTLPLDVGTYKNSLTNTNNEDFIFESTTPTITLRLSNEDVNKEFHVFEAFEIHPNNHQGLGESYKTAASRVRVGGYIPYYYNGNNFELKEYLKRLEIGVNNNNLSCFLYALKQSSQIPSETINKISLLCSSKYLKIKDINLIIKQFSLNIELKYYNSDFTKDETIIKPKDKKTATRICLWKNHFFINERTPFNKDLEAKRSHGSLPFTRQNYYSYYSKIIYFHL
jgi:hypothetical protein